MLILMVHPPALFSVSFQLSFTAVFSILYGLTKWRIPAEFDDGPWRKLGKRLLSFMAVSLFAILGVLPLALRYFNQTSLVGLGANLIAVPLIGFIVVPLGLLSALVSLFSAPAASLGFLAGAMVLKPALGFITIISGFPLAAIKTVTPSFLEICWYYTFLGAVTNIRGPSSPRPLVSPGASLPLFRRLLSLPRRKIARIILAAVVIVIIADAAWWTRVRLYHEDLRVTVMDVGQGSAALVEFPGGPCMLVDGGGFSDNSIFDVGARVTAPVLWGKKIKTVDILALSHPNSDHVNGFTYIADHFNVKTLWSNNEPADTLGYERFMETIKNEKTTIENFKTMPREFEIEGVRISVLNPPRDFLSKIKEENWRDSNNNSLVLKLQFGAISILFPGDIQSRAEAEITALAGDSLPSTVLLAPHHGSKTSSTPIFLDKVNPEIVIISSGWRSRKRFPTPGVLQRYQQRQCRIYRTHAHGAITLTTDGKT
ncbi:MAG: MBL fold metallo-hydrolase, partial [Desulfobacterales bacterium]|nr:MBL fold metallo-hydrolase [Desulfobacterales bacterium]